MSDSVIGEPAPVAPIGLTAGTLLRQARLARGLHIAALATSIKVAPRKLELLESDRFDELPDATFARALAQTVCRSLKIDAAPVLALLPQPVDRGLEHLSLGLNAPFRDRPDRRAPRELQFLRSPIMLGALALVVASLGIYFLPAGWINETLGRAVAPAPAASATSVSVSAAQPATEAPIPLPGESFASDVPGTTVMTEPARALPAPPAKAVAVPTVAASRPALPAATSSGTLLLRATDESWVEVIDGHGSVLMSRMLQPGEAVGLDGILPYRVKIGNASATMVTFKGKLLDLQATRENVAKLELK